MKFPDYEASRLGFSSPKNEGRYRPGAVVFDRFHVLETPRSKSLEKRDGGRLDWGVHLTTFGPVAENGTGPEPKTGTSMYVMYLCHVLSHVLSCELVVHGERSPCRKRKHEDRRSSRPRLFSAHEPSHA